MCAPHLHLFLVFPMCLRPAVGPIKTFVSPIEVTRHRPCCPRGCSFAVGRSPPSPGCLPGGQLGAQPVSRAGASLPGRAVRPAGSPRLQHLSEPPWEGASSSSFLLSACLQALDPKGCLRTCPYVGHTDCYVRLIQNFR